jgi:protein required for attachment to host cells
MHNSDWKIQTSASAMLPDSPHKIDAGYPRHAPQKSAAARVSVCQQIEENPSMCAPSSQHQLPKEVDISPPKKKNAGYASKKLASVISLDCKAISPSKTKSLGSASKELSSVISLDHKAKSVNGNNTGDNGGTKKSAGKNSDKVLASVLVKPSPESKEKGKSVKQVTRKPDKVQNNVPGFSNGSAGLTARPVIGAKKAKKIVIKKIVRKIGASNKQTSSTVTPEQKDGVDANANECEKEEGEITTSSYEKDDSSAQNLISTSDTAHVGSSVLVETEQNGCFINPCKRNATSAIESAGILDTASVSGSQHPEKEDDRSLTRTGDTNATPVADSAQVLDTIGSEHPGDRGCMDLGGQSAALLCENSISHVEEDDIAVSSAMNVVVASNSPRTPGTMKLQEYNVLEVMTGNNAACVNGVKDDAKQVGESTNSRRAKSNKKDHNKMEFSMDENIQKKESQMSIYSNTLATTHHIESPNRTEIFSYEVCGSEVCRGHNDSDETLICTLDNSIDTPEFVLAGGTKDSCTQELLHDQRIVLNKLNLHHEAADMGFSNFPLAKNVESTIKLLDGDSTEDSSAPIISNKDVGNATISQAAELIHLHRADLSPANSEHSLPTALTLGNNTYFSSVGSEQPKENHKLMESSKGLDNVTEADFDRIEKGKSELDNT